MKAIYFTDEELAYLYSYLKVLHVKTDPCAYDFSSKQEEDAMIQQHCLITDILQKMEDESNE